MIAISLKSSDLLGEVAASSALPWAPYRAHIGTQAFDPWATELTDKVAALQGGNQTSSGVPQQLQGQLFCHIR